MRENTYQGKLIKKIRARFPGAFIIKNDSGAIQGIPDLLVLYRDKWAMLEVKPSEDADFEANQEYYIDLFDDMSFGAVIYPGNEREILDELQLAFRVGRAACVS